MVRSGGMEDKERQFTHAMKSIIWAVCSSREPLLAQLQKTFGAGQSFSLVVCLLDLSE